MRYNFMHVGFWNTKACGVVTLREAGMPVFVTAGTILQGLA